MTCIVITYLWSILSHELIIKLDIGTATKIDCSISSWNSSTSHHSSIWSIRSKQNCFIVYVAFKNFVHFCFVYTVASAKASVFIFDLYGDDFENNNFFLALFENYINATHLNHDDGTTICSQQMFRSF